MVKKEEINKKCTKCLNNKILCEFNKNKDGKYGVMSICNICKKEARELNKDNIKEQHINYYQNNKTKLKEKTKEYRKANPEKVKKLNKKYREANLEKIKNLSIKYRKLNSHIVAWRGMLNNSLRNLDKKKEGKTIELLGYSALDLRNYMINLFTEGMTWDNHGEWHIDHIKGIVNFDKEIHPSIVNSLNNLRPLWATTREINGVIYEGNLNRNKY